MPRLRGHHCERQRSTGARRSARYDKVGVYSGDSQRGIEYGGADVLPWRAVHRWCTVTGNSSTGGYGATLTVGIAA